MKKSRLTIGLATLLFGLASLQAQTVTVSPLPQSITWGEKAFDSATASYSLTGAEDADADAVAQLQTHLNVNGGSIQLFVGERGDNAVSAYTDRIPTQAEGYYLSVEPGRVVIAGNDERGTFYGVQTFLQIAAQPDVMSVTVTDYPDVADRGVVEGFYGNPWSHTDRLRQFEFYGRNKMNVYIYGPKDDPYHRARWREEYPAAEAAQLQALVEAAHKNKVRFVWAVHPGNDIQWNNADSLNIVHKLEAMYALGVRSFAVFFDDIGGEGTRAEKQAQLMNYINAEFTHQHDDIEPLILCPTEYNRGWAGADYLPTLGTQMDADVRIMWTGNSVVDMINLGDMEWINDKISRKAYIWLNYPVNDYCIDRMLMGPTYGNDKNIASLLSGFTSNPMEYAEASKVSLYSIADYSWNMEDYDEQASWLRAIAYLMPGHEKAFYTFCENNIDLGVTAHGLRRAGESATFKAAADVFEAAMSEGYNEEAVKAMTLQFDTLVLAADELLSCTTEPELVAEITPWVQVMRYMGRRGQLLMSMYSALEQQKAETFVDLYLEMKELETAQKEVRSRDFEGSIKSPNPTVAGEVVAPFLKQHTAELVRTYKQQFDYRLDVFPVDLLDEGRYYIKYNGKYLTDVNANPDKTGDYPTFQTEEDNINPQRQEWRISIDAETERYKIVNAQDGRYINENGSFWADKNVNPYDASWHSYNLYRLNGLYAIQNAGSAGNAFWTSNGTRIQKSSTTAIKYGNFVFDIVPVEGATAHPTVEEGKRYYIFNGDQVLTNGTPNGNGGAPTFTGRSLLKRDQQLWYFTPIEGTGRFKLTNYKDGRYVNELGNFGANAYSDDWNTYILTELGGLFSIQNAGEAGTKFWTIEDNRIQPAAIERKDSYLFRIISLEDFTAVESATADADITYRVDSGRIQVNSPSPIRYIRLVDTDGKTVRETRNGDTLSLGRLAKNAYILSIENKEGKHTFKVQLP